METNTTLKERERIQNFEDYKPLGVVEYAKQKRARYIRPVCNFTSSGNIDFVLRPTWQYLSRRGWRNIPKKYQPK